MTQEEIEQEARAYSALIVGGPRHIQDFYEREKYEAGFISGANWRVNSIWYEITKLPKPDKWIFLLREDGTIKQIYTYDGVDKLFNTLLGYKWAYVEDLIPIKED